jgi:tetrapyrrole methylase family protein/MazG family protein/ATP diphosphatase
MTAPDRKGNNNPDIEGCFELCSELIAIIRRLRAPDGCPWDREQTPQSVRKYILEEAYELSEAICQKDAREVMEELGDLIFLLLFVAELYQEEKLFSLPEALISIREKMIRRHPHIFGDVKVEGTADVVANWQAIKSQEAKKKGKKKGVLGDLPKALPALQRAFRLGERASRIGFDWQGHEAVWEKFREEEQELRQAISARDKEAIFEEMGDLLFTISNLARKLDVNPEEALRAANSKFETRFKAMEEEISRQGKDIHAMELEELDAYWDLIKADGKGRQKGH